MKTYEHELAHSYEHSKSIWRYSSASFLQSLSTALVLGTIAALMGVAASAALYYRHVVWYISLAAGPLVDTLVVIRLATIALEQARKRSIRRTLELSFLNHHLRNALTQIMVVPNLTDADRQDRFIREAISRISGALFRVANSADLAGLSLEVDLRGTELTHEGEERENSGGREGPGSLIRQPRLMTVGHSRILTRAAALAGKSPIVAAQNLKRLLRCWCKRDISPTA
jgi:hypothetical protein